MGVNEDILRARKNKRIIDLELLQKIHYDRKEKSDKFMNYTG